MKECVYARASPPSFSAHTHTNGITHHVPNHEQTYSKLKLYTHAHTHAHTHALTHSLSHTQAYHDSKLKLLEHGFELSKIDPVEAVNEPSLL